MRKLWFAVAAVALALGGCSDDDPRPADVPAPAVSTRPAEAFVPVVQEQLPQVAVDRRAEEIEAIGTQTCADLVTGRTADDVIAAARYLGTEDAEAVDRATARELVKLAIGTVCPDQSGRAAEF